MNMLGFSLFFLECVGVVCPKLPVQRTECVLASSRAAAALLPLTAMFIHNLMGSSWVSTATCCMAATIIWVHGDTLILVSRLNGQNDWLHCEMLNETRGRWITSRSKYDRVKMSAQHVGWGVMSPCKEQWWVRRNYRHIYMLNVSRTFRDDALACKACAHVAFYW